MFLISLYSLVFTLQRHFRSKCRHAFVVRVCLYCRLSMNVGIPAAIRVSHTLNTFVWPDDLHQGWDIWSWQSLARGGVSGTHSRRGAPRCGRGSGDAVMFSRQLQQEWRGGRLLLSWQKTSRCQMENGMNGTQVPGCVCG